MTISPTGMPFQVKNQGIPINIIRDNNTYVLATSARTSAGVYDGNTLLRTLWTCKSERAGIYTVEWDGKDDDGNTVTEPESKTIQILENNVQYEWEGVLGNTSTDYSGSGIHTGYYFGIVSMVTVGNYAYYAIGYVERKDTVAKFEISKPQVRIPIQSFDSPASVYHIATDATLVYFACKVDHNNRPERFVYAIDPKTDQQYVFPSSEQSFQNYNSIIDYNDQYDDIVGLAASSYLFVAHPSAIHVFDKASGAFLRRVEINGISTICTDSDSLYVVHENKAVRYFVTVTGHLTDTGFEINGLIDPIAIAVIGGDVAITQAGDLQQVIAYDQLTGEKSWTYGVEGGNKTNAIVTDSTFAIDKQYPSFLLEQTDGSFWMGDTLNYRAIRVRSDRAALLDVISWIPACYTCRIVSNDTSRIIADWQEFSVDVSKPLKQSWKLTHNYRYLIPTELDPFRKFLSVVKLSNGRTYVQGNVSNGSKIYELNATSCRDTGIFFGGAAFTYMLPNGDVIRYTLQLDQPLTYFRYILTGFDLDQNPVYDGGSEIGTTPALTAENPLGTNIGNNITSTGIILTFDDAAAGRIRENGHDVLDAEGRPIYDSRHQGWHLGAIRIGSTGKWLWRTLKATSPYYAGPYPHDRFDIGNGTNYPGGIVSTVGRHIFENHHGEFWKGTQTNKFHHVWDNGLQIGVFGVAKSLTPAIGTAGMAGNVLSPAPVIIGDDIAIYTGDETFHSGIHRWMVRNLKSIKIHALPARILKHPSPLGVNLMFGLPVGQILPGVIAGWSRWPVSNAGDWDIRTGVKTYDINMIDISVYHNRQQPGAYLQRSLGSVDSTNWQIKGSVNYEYSNYNRDSSFGQYFELIDEAGKILIHFSIDQNYLTNIITGTANGVTLFKGNRYQVEQYCYDPVSFIISTTPDKGIRFSYGDLFAEVLPYDAEAIATKPAFLRFSFYGNPNPPNYGVNISVKDLYMTP